MKRENIILAAGALLATTSLTTTSFASTTGIVQGLAQVAPGTAVAMGNQFVSAQAFATPASTSATIGPFNIYVKLVLPLQVSGLSGNIALTGASFSAGPTTARAVVFGTGFTVESTVTSSNICSSVLTTAAAILLTTCDGTTANLSNGGGGLGTASAASTNGFFLSGVTINNATGMATAGGTISLANTMTVSSTTVDSQAAAVELTSRDGLVVAVAAPRTVASIDVAASPSFTKFTSSSLSTILATVSISTNSALGADLSGFVSGVALYNNAEVRITSASLTDDASLSVTIGADVATRSAGQYTAGFVTFNLTGAAGNVGDFAITHNFNGTKEIEAVAAGTTVVTFTAPTVTTTGNSVNVSAQAAVSGSAGALTRNGLSIDFNGVYPSTYAPTYTSYIRVVNTGTAKGKPSIIITNENTGVALGTFTATVDVDPGASAQYSIKDIETTLAITPSSSILYRARIGGSITGYAQHVIWNQTSGFFTDMSSRRTSVTGNN